jgi:hypothetical protein
MTVTIDSNSTTISIEDEDVAPLPPVVHKGGLFIGSRTFPGFVRFDLKPSKKTALRVTKEAFTATGKVKFLLGTGDTLDGWKVGFVQIDRKTLLQATYLGRKDDEGAIVIDPTSKFPGAKSTALDVSIKAAAPWYTWPVEKTQFKAGVASPIMGDGPGMDVPLILANGLASNADNYLRSYVDLSQYFTILSVVASDKSRQYLAYFAWSVSYTVTFKWTAGPPTPCGPSLPKISVDQDQSKYIMNKAVVAGQPSDPDMAPILAKPDGQPLANDVFKPEFFNAIIGNDPTTHQEFKDWSRLFSPPPSDFWT